MKKWLTKGALLRTISISLVLIIVIVGLVLHTDWGSYSALGIGELIALCPLGYLETFFASRLFIPRAFVVFLGVLLITIVLGKVFCAWICPFPLTQRLLARITSKVLPKNTPADTEAIDTEVPKCARLDTRLLTLVGVLGASLFAGFPVFCLVCPLGLTFALIAGIVYLITGGASLGLTFLFIPVFLVLELLFFRRWCSKICPLGALYALISRGNRFFRPHIDAEACLSLSGRTECSHCYQVCKEHIDIRATQTTKTLADCSKCRDCSDVCPVHAVSFPVLPKKKPDAD
ncbi:MAG: 4Fe-4S binding protein [Coriobacteriaceae bacterium]|jgi:ferredoxin-type protein NapH|nr:4Fe-4S binding protein [Coriobacteriaceae bacterium]